MEGQRKIRVIKPKNVKPKINDQPTTSVNKSTFDAPQKPKIIRIKRGPIVSPKKQEVTIVQPLQCQNQRPPTPEDQQTKNMMLNKISTTTNDEVLLKKEPATAVHIEQEEQDPDILLIPLDMLNSHTSKRASTSKYLVNVKGCTHPVHDHVGLSSSDLKKKCIYPITENDYGTKYPIVSTHNLVHCRKCLPDNHPIIKKSMTKGVLKFYVPLNRLKKMDYLKFPPELNESLPLQEIGDDVWVNLAHPELVDTEKDYIRDRIITLTKRKNYEQYFCLPPPFQDASSGFSDFGAEVILAMCSEGYDDSAIVIQPDDDDEILVEDPDDPSLLIPIKRSTVTIREEPKHVEDHITQAVQDEFDSIIEDDLQGRPAEINHEQEVLTDNVPVEENVLDDDEDDYDSDVDKSVCDEEVREILEQKSDPRLEDLKLNMENADDYNNNVKIVSWNLYPTGHLATYDNKSLSINFPGDIPIEVRDTIIKRLTNAGFQTSEFSFLKIFINGEMQTRWSIIVNNFEPRPKLVSPTSTLKSSVTDISTQTEDDVKNIVENHPLDEKINDILQEALDTSAATVAMIFETEYLQSINNGNNVNIKFTPMDVQLTRGISRRNMAILQKCVYPSDWLDDNNLPYGTSLLHLLLYLRYNTIILPEHVKYENNTIIISTKNE